MANVERQIEEHKYELTKRLTPLITREGLTDVTDWVKKNGGSIGEYDCSHDGVARSVAYILEATGDFQLEQLEDRSRYYVKKLPRRSLEQKYPTLFKISLVLFGALLTIMANLTRKVAPLPEIRIEDSRISALKDSVFNLGRELETLKDSVASYKGGQKTGKAP